MQSSSVLLPPRLPTRLLDWPSIEDYQNPDVMREPWDIYDPFLASYGYALFDTPSYDDINRLSRLPQRPAMNPFCPKDDEDFIYHNGGRTPDPLGNFRQQTAATMIGLDIYGRQVVFKATRRHSMEYQILAQLNSSHLRSNPRNHTIPVKFIPADDFIFMVMPCWGTCWTWPGFDSTQSRLKAATQLLEGLVFMHKNGVSHGDIQEGNVVWNHDEYRRRAPDGTTYQRTNFDFRMAYIDFGSSTLFKPNQPPLIQTSKAPPVTLIAPELEKEGTWYDAFAADVYSLGMTLREEIQNALTGRARESQIVADVARETPQWYHQLLETMIDSDPQGRPTAKKALTYIRHMAARISY